MFRLYDNVVHKEQNHMSALCLWAGCQVSTIALHPSERPSHSSGLPAKDAPPPSPLAVTEATAANEMVAGKDHICCSGILTAPAHEEPLQPKPYQVASSRVLSWGNLDFSVAYPCCTISPIMCCCIGHPSDDYQIQPDQPRKISPAERSFSMRLVKPGN